MMDNYLTRLDQTVTRIFSEWDYVSTALLIASISCSIYFTVNYRDPDTHPLLLVRQSQPSSIRQVGKSAVFRSHSAPHGTTLFSGLNIKNPSDSKWAHGRDGDLKDIWERIVSGTHDKQGHPTGEIGKLLTLHGSRVVIEHDLGEITNQIKQIGKYLKESQRDRIAIYLPNSVEFLVVLFASAYYDLTIVLLQYNQPLLELLNQLKVSKADTLIAAAGSFPIEAVLEDNHTLNHLIWVVDEGNEHMDWKEISSESGKPVSVTIWKEIFQDRVATKNLPYSDKSAKLKKIIAFPTSEAVEFSHSNIIAAIAGQLSAVPATQSFTPSDLFLPIDCLSDIYPLTLTLAALYSNASVALTSVASHSPSLILATRGISPTVIAASDTTMLKLHEETKQRLSTPIYNLVHWLETRELVRDGVMPIASFFSRFYDQLRPVIGTAPGKLRLIYISTPIGSKSQISSLILSDLRIYTRSRIIYALTAPKVAGAVTQTGIYDYRVSKNQRHVHFGAPVASLELYFQDKEIYKSTDTTSSGEIIVTGPAVVGGVANLGVVGKMNDDLTLGLLG